MNVLLVDDDPIMQRATTRMLPRFHVDAVSDAEQALAAVDRNHYDAVVVDACLGAYQDRAGIRLVSELRARGCAAGIVLVSGVVKDELDEETRRVGADAALLKGDFDGPVLRAVIERVVAARVQLPRDADDDELPDDLRTLAGDVLDTFARERALHAEQAYRLALLAKAAFAHPSLKGSPIEACARAVGLSRQTLQPYALVATRWSAPELRHLLAERRNSRGEPISISHLVLLAKLPRATRDTWTERVFAEGLTVRQLREILKVAARD
jgi:DNA-binding NarL/FixJ family response regulator